ncbi:MAG TPA: sugar phosphate isomerase/epimerase family protein [Chthoniobacterales bacterium]
MNIWPIGLSTGCFYQNNILDCLLTIRESGFSFIEVCSAPRHLDYHDLNAVQTAATRIHELGMAVFSFHAPFADHIDISAIETDRREIALREILQAVEAAATLNAQYLVIHPGPEHAVIPPPEERLQRMENTVGVLNQVARRCTELGIGCALENKLPHLLFGNTSDILWILDALEDMDAGACLDTGHAHLSGDLFNLVRKLAGHLRMIHAHDNNGTGDDHLPPGDGRINWEQLLHDLSLGGFHGPLIVEMAGTESPETTMSNARRGRSWLRKISRHTALKPH